MAILCAYRTEITLAVVMIGLNCRCSKQENTVQNIVLGPPAIPDWEYWYKLGEVDKDTISVLYACRSGQIGLHSELTIKKTDINGKDVYTSVIGNLSEGRWRIFPKSFSCSNAIFSFAMYRADQSERRDTAEFVAYTINGNTGKLLDTTPKKFFKERESAIKFIISLKILMLSFRMPRIMAIYFMWINMGKISGSEEWRG